jgi:hypothetical protein
MDTIVSKREMTYFPGAMANGCEEFGIYQALAISKLLYVWELITLRDFYKTVLN